MMLSEKLIFEFLGAYQTWPVLALDVPKAMHN